MSETQKDQTPTTSSAAPAAPKPKPAPKKEKAPGSGFAKFLALLALVVAIAASAFGWQQLQLLKQQIAEQSQEKKPAQDTDQLATFKKNMAKRIDSFNDQQHVLKRKLETLENAVSTVANENTRDQRGWTLAEAQYLMNMANSRLRLLRDVSSAAEALKGADQRIASLNDPALFTVRELLAEEISNLQALGVMDSNGVALKLLALNKQVQKLPPAKLLLSAGGDIQEETVGEKDSVLAEISNFIGLKKSNRPYMALPQQEDIFYLDQLMRLEVEAARHAVLRFDEKTYANHIKAATELLNKHYDQDNQQVQAVKNQLLELKARKVFPALPDITASAIELHKIRNRYIAPAATVEKTEPNAPATAAPAPSDEVEAAQEQTL